jgi:hypothetical protein
VSFFLVALMGGLACRHHAIGNVAEPEPLTRTEFTERIENFFEYAPLRAGKPSRFNIHLTDLAEGSPVAGAEVTLTVRTEGGEEVASRRARAGKVAGIYVAELSVPAGRYALEFHVRAAGLDERMPLRGFTVE